MVLTGEGSVLEMTFILILYEKLFTAAEKAESVSILKIG
jgi:hypothetical protein